MSTTKIGATEVETTELDRQAVIIKSGEAATVQRFYDWLHEEKGYVLARYIPKEERVPGDQIFGGQPMPVFDRPEQLMAEFFGIDLQKIERERMAILEAIRSADD